MGSRLQRVLWCLSVYAISSSLSLQPKDCFGCLPVPRSSMCSEQFQLCVKTIIIIKSHAPLPRPVTSMEQMGRGLASARVFPPSVQLAWCLQKGLFCFSLWLLSTSLVASGTDCSWKIVSRVVSARKEKVVLSAACLLLLVHTPGWEQAGKGNWVFGSPSESADLCLRPASGLSLAGQSKSYILRITEWAGLERTTGVTSPGEAGAVVEEPHGPSRGVVLSCCGRHGWGTHRGCCWCWQCHTELIDDPEQQKHRGRQSEFALGGCPSTHPSLQLPLHVGLKARCDQVPFGGWSLCAVSPQSKKQKSPCSALVSFWAPDDVLSL